jgi:Transposase DDE domain group 1
METIRASLPKYRETLLDDRRLLLDRYHLVDAAIKVVGNRGRAPAGPATPARSCLSACRFGRRPAKPARWEPGSSTRQNIEHPFQCCRVDVAVDANPATGGQGRDQVDPPVMCSFAAKAVRLQLHVLAYNLGNLMRTLAMPDPIKHWSLTSLREKLIKIGAKVVSHRR